MTLGTIKFASSLTPRFNTDARMSKDTCVEVHCNFDVTSNCMHPDSDNLYGDMRAMSSKSGAGAKQQHEWANSTSACVYHYMRAQRVPRGPQEISQ